MLPHFYCDICTFPLQGGNIECCFNLELCEKRYKRREEDQKQLDDKEDNAEERRKIRDDKRVHNERLIADAKKLRDGREAAAAKIRDDKKAFQNWLKQPKKTWDNTIAEDNKTAKMIRDLDERIAVASAAKKIQDDKTVQEKKTRDCERIAVASAAKKIQDDKTVQEKKTRDCTETKAFQNWVKQRKKTWDNTIGEDNKTAKMIRDLDERIAVASAAKTHGPAGKRCEFEDCGKVARQGGGCDEHRAFTKAAREEKKSKRAEETRMEEKKKKAEMERRRAEKEKIRDDKKAEKEKIQDDKRSEKKRKRTVSRSPLARLDGNQQQQQQHDHDILSSSITSLTPATGSTDADATMVTMMTTMKTKATTTTTTTASSTTAAKEALEKKYKNRESQQKCRLKKKVTAAAYNTAIKAIERLSRDNNDNDNSDKENDLYKALEVSLSTIYYLPDDNKIALALAAKLVLDDKRAEKKRKTEENKTKRKALQEKKKVALAKKTLEIKHQKQMEMVRALAKKILQKKHNQPGGPYNKNKKARKAKGTRFWHGIRYDLMTEQDLKQAKAEVEAAPQAYADMQIMLQNCMENYKKTGKHIGTGFCIFSTSNHNVTPEIPHTPEIPLSSFYFSSKAQSHHQDHLLTTFPRYNGTIILMGPPVRGSYKFYEKGGGYQQPYHGATSGKGWSAVLIGMMLADDCTKAYDELKTHGLTNTRVIEILEAWDKGAPDSAKIKKFYEKHLQYQPLGFYRSDRDKEGYVKIGLAFNLIAQYKKLMKEEISTSFNEDNKVEVYAPELVSLMDISMGSPRIHIYPAGTGEMGAHHDSYNNKYDDIRQQKYSILFDINDYKNKC